MLTNTEILYMVFLVASTYVGLQINQAHLKISASTRFLWVISYFSANYLIKELAGPFNWYVYGVVIAAMCASLVNRLMFGFDAPKL